MIRDITLGQFFPGKSILHRLDPRVKIVLVFSFVLVLFIAQHYISFTVLFFSILILMFFSGVPIRMYFKSMKTILFIVLFTSILNLFYGIGEPIFSFGFMTITLDGIKNSILVAVRITSLLFISSLLTFTTSPNDLTDAMERLMKPLCYLKVNVHEIAMMMTIALRFVPTLLEETDKIMNAQKARGADLENGNFTQRIRALIPILIPLFVSSFRCAYDLAMAMECRCYRGGEGRTRMKVLHIHMRDVCAISLSAVILLFVIFHTLFLSI